MKTSLRIGLFLGALLVVPVQAHAWCICCPPLPHIKVDCGCHCHFRVYCDHPPEYPWYLYFPYDPRYQMPVAPVSPFPNWPGPTAGVPVPVAPVAPAFGAGQRQAPPQFQPVGYNYPQAPSYWYNR
jgi:hypothetical protein